MLTYEQIKQLCKSKGVTVTQAERECGFSKGSLCKIETNRPNSKRVETLAKYFGISVEAIMYGDSDTRTDEERKIDEYLMDANIRRLVLFAGSMPRANRERYTEAIIAALQATVSKGEKL